MKDERFLAFIIGVAVGILIMLIAVAVIIGPRYKHGQIDALTGHAIFCLDDRYEWVDGKPSDGLRCQGVRGEK